ncbi:MULTISPECIES: N-acetylglucosamine-6-phosphate deacetylase [Anoxybacillus]|uniref:N-acetylglucosamine-6-phosphate deacetylase n=1 Tax=Anoxybacillus TaxID=150247 RepID=UPI001868D058|nr:N-acetylglucosamine-6-phosphate deacetylase [Anoxybacillus flavithermus]MBE2941056.1 N-acetylglucosamine-6-phosphate deacetylase [Anoxybacillus flavithermus]MBE2943701.1 N-acetylglucosamine-6-phosphate deacetylase [Anoxybacillus flavithermus]MBE2951960.1 N-acetylglucosamine-6-phosphate deacetylase [Anoxybacillus flavithermus]MBE2954528.1 N-acetylglucosamine-6-phosphate deacetylase [Anoxybacillus flavithermus]MBE2960103.1 N-acetylglucosamine-6-phosphate deacetylase [Anoxybacillus flavithermu
MNRFLLKNATVYAEEGWIENGCVLVEGEKIAYVGSNTFFPDVPTIELAPRYFLVPGFIDLHIHGAFGADVMDASMEALQTIVSRLPEEGTTSFLATTMTAPAEQIEQAVENVARYMRYNVPGQSEVLGIHLEGPFLSPKRAGAQHPRDIIEPNVALFQHWQQKANGNIRLVTLAPEENNGIALVSYLKENDVIASIGHSDAGYEQVKKAIQAGVTHVTHLFNGMSGIHHRTPGVALAALMHEEVMCELIADGIHVAPEMVWFAYKNKGKEGLVIITDSMRAKCFGEGKFGEGEYELGGQRVVVRNGKAMLVDGTLAGSVLTLKQAVQNVIAFAKCSLEDAIHMASWNPAKQLGVLDRKGSIRTGKDADLVVLNETYEVVMTFCRGKLAYDRRGNRCE